MIFRLQLLNVCPNFPVNLPCLGNGRGIPACWGVAKGDLVSPEMEPSPVFRPMDAVPG